MVLAILRQALSDMRAHRLWAALTMFGIIWGTASVVLLVGWGIGVHGMIDRGLQKVGKNLMYIMPGHVGEDLSPADERKTITFELEDVEALRASARRAELVTGELQQWMYVRHGQNARNADVRGVEPLYRELVGVRMAAGRFLSADDVELRRRVAVIGQTARQRLLGARPALGQRLTLNGQRFTVVGLLDHVGTQLTRNHSLIDEQIWVPLTTMMTLTDREDVELILARPPERRYNAALKREVRSILAERLHVSPRDEEAIYIVSLIDFLAGFDAVFGFLTVFMVFLATTTLFIGGIGVMNMMLVSVNDRRREIGLRLAVGARRRHVVGQFLVETLLVTLVGGFLGLGLGLGACALLGRLPRDVVPVPVIVPEVAVLALAITTLVGVISGVAPAWRAASVTPSESLRAE